MASGDWSKVDAEDESIDPRIHIELERLNTSTDLINKLERDLDIAKTRFRGLLCDSTIRLDELSRKLGSTIEKARPYYDARIQASAATKEAQEAAYQYEKANSAHSAAREMVFLAEQGLGGKCTLDPAWQEMLNHATQRVNEAETARARSNIAHMIAGRKLMEKTTRVQKLQKDLKRTIAKSRPYFETKAQLNYQLELQKNKIQLLEKKIQNAKISYSEALRSLEQISDEIHKIRRTSQDVRGENGFEKEEDDDIDDDIKIIQSPSSGNVQRVESTNAAVYYNQTYIPDSLHPNFYDFHQFKKVPSKGSQTTSNPIKSQYSQSLANEICDEFKVVSPELTKRECDDNELRKIASTNEMESDTAESLRHNSSNEWTEIDLDSSSPEDINLIQCTKDIPYQRLSNNSGDNLDDEIRKNVGAVGFSSKSFTLGVQESRSSDIDKVVKQVTKTPVVTRQVTMPAMSGTSTNPTSKSSSSRLDSANIVNWISRSAIKDEDGYSYDGNHRQSLDNILGPGTSEKVKSIFSQASNILNITNLTSGVGDRRSSEPRLVYDHTSSSCSLNVNNNSNNIPSIVTSCVKKVPSPFDKTHGYLAVNSTDTGDDTGSDTDSIASCDMLTEEQIHNLMLDKDIDVVCEKILGTPMNELCGSMSKLDILPVVNAHFVAEKIADVTEAQHISDKIKLKSDIDTLRMELQASSADCDSVCEVTAKKNGKIERPCELALRVDRRK